MTAGPAEAPESAKPPARAVSRTALASGGVGSVVAALVAGYGVVTATAGEDLEVGAMIGGLLAGLIAIAAIVSAARDWREATARMESHMPVLRLHGQRLRETPSADAVREAALLLEDARRERELLVQMGAHRQAADMTAALAELTAAMEGARATSTSDREHG